MGSTAFGQYDLGAVAGLNVSKIGGENSGGDNTFRLSPMVGVVLDLELTETLDLRGEVDVFSGKGGINSFGQEAQVNTVFNYLDFGAMVSYNLSYDPRIAVYGGPILSYLWTAENKFSDYTDNIEPWIKDVDMAIGAGVEAEIIEKLSLGLRLQGSITTLPKYSGDKSYNRVIQLYMKYDIKRFY